MVHMSEGTRTEIVSHFQCSRNTNGHSATALCGHNTSRTHSVAVGPGPAAPDAGFHGVAERGDGDSSSLEYCAEDHGLGHGGLCSPTRGANKQL